MKFAPFCSLLILAFCTRMALATPRYSVTDLGDLVDGAHYSSAVDINASGQVAGVGQVNSSFRAFLSSNAPGGGTTLVDLGNLSPLQNAHALGINSLGQVVGLSNEGDRARAFLWSPVAPNSSEGSMSELTGLPGERNSAMATSINGSGQVVGFSVGHAYLWTPESPNGTTGTAVDLGALDGGTASNAYDVNDSGQVVGNSLTTVDRAFLWTPSTPNGSTGSMIALDGLPGGNDVAHAASINASGTVVGNSATATGQHAVIWRPGSSGANPSVVDLSEFEGGSDLGYALGINAANQVVGSSNSSDGDRAFLWTEADGMLDLNTLTDSTGAAWTLGWATSINDQGEIVGWGTFDPDGAGEIPPVTHAFRLEPIDGPGQPTRLANISTRVRVLPGDNALIGGFIVTGDEPKKVILRGLGPSIGGGIQGALADPILELHQGNVIIAQNDNWHDSQAAEIAATTIPPAYDLESAIVRTLDPGSYTVVLRGRGETSGTGLVEVYDLGLGATSKLANISTRGLVGTGDDVMIGGLVVSGDGGPSAQVIVRGIGPSLSDLGVPGALQDPMLELHDGNGALIASNDNWRNDHEAEIIATNLSPSRDAESAIIGTLASGNYTAILRGVNAATGVGLIEVYQLQ
jgi:probable HAF family extracellular repeat protein